MNLNEFNNLFGKLKDKDVVTVSCDFTEHMGDRNITMPKVSVKRNIMKNEGVQFICGKCTMTHKNPMKNKDGIKRQTNEEIIVICPDERHSGTKSRTMKMSGYFGKLEEPYTQICKSCAQLDKVISEEQKNKIRNSLTGIVRSDEYKQKLKDYYAKNPQARARVVATLLKHKCCTGMLGKHHTEEHKKKMSEIMSGRTYTDEHRKNISEGRKKMLDAQGGLLKETKEKLSKAAVEQHINGFDPNTHHARGRHISSKSSKIIKYRSSYEKKALMKLDEDDNVVKYEYESRNSVVKYQNPIKGITSSYLIDLTVEYKDGTKKLIEVKPNKWLQDPVIAAKIAAGHDFAIQNNMEFEVWEEIALFGAVYNEKNMRLFCEKVKSGELD